jgi:hypothetical protein
MKLHDKLLQSSALILFLVFVSLTANAQQDTSSYKKNAIYFEFGGSGGDHSTNYERIVKHFPVMDLALRVGMGYYNLIDYKDNFNPDMVFPFMAIVTYGKNHKIEAGVGQTYSSTIETDIQTGEPARMNNFSTIFNIGYRYQNPSKRILIRAGYTPFIEFNGKVS